MNDGTIELARWRGAPIYLHPLFLLTAVLLAMLFWRRFDLTGLVLAVLFGLVIFASLLAHEFAHALAAGHFRNPTLRIDIHALGGFVTFARHARTRTEDLLVTAAGPAINLAIGLAAMALLAGARNLGLPTMVATLLDATAWLNLAMAAANLLPAFPLDGGKLAYLAIEARFGARAATLTVSITGLVCAVVLILLLVATALAGVPIFVPPGFAHNWRVFQAARAGASGWDRFAYERM